MWITDQKPEEHRQVDIWVQMPDGNGKLVPDVLHAGSQSTKGAVLPLFNRTGRNSNGVDAGAYAARAGVNHGYLPCGAVSDC